MGKYKNKTQKEMFNKLLKVACVATVVKAQGEEEEEGEGA